jgi:hypothetical protein
MHDLLASRRVHERLLGYWRHLKGERPYPREDEVDPETLSDIWDSCFLVEVMEPTHAGGYRYAYMGPSLIQAYGDDWTNKDIAQRLLEPHTQELMHKFEKVVQSRSPVHDESEFDNAGRVHIKYRSCMLPLGKSPGKVDYILGVMRWRAY